MLLSLNSEDSVGTYYVKHLLPYCFLCSFSMFLIHMARLTLPASHTVFALLLLRCCWNVKLQHASNISSSLSSSNATSSVTDALMVFPKSFPQFLFTLFFPEKKESTNGQINKLMVFFIREWWIHSGASAKCQHACDDNVWDAWSESKCKFISQLCCWKCCKTCGASCC